MHRSAVASPLLCAAAWIASAADPSPPVLAPALTPAPSIEITIRDVGDTARVLSDNLGGWRLERYFSDLESLLSAEDSYGWLVQVTRDMEGRPIAILLAERFALEYFYSRPGGPWQRRILYEPRSGEVIAQVVNSSLGATGYEPDSYAPKTLTENDGVATVTAGGRSYAFISAAEGSPVIRSLDIDDPSTGTDIDRIDYTDSHLVVHLGSDVEGRPRVFTIPRHIQQNSQPTVVEIGEPHGARNDAVWSLAGRRKSAVVPVPNLRGALPSAVVDTLREAYPLALHKVREAPGCRSLFEEFAISGNQRLTTTLYSPPNQARTVDSCARGALAYTHVGSSITYLCEAFGGLSRDQATIVLIHEALHFAGMEEAPFYEDSLTSKEINELVHDQCGF